MSKALGEIGDVPRRNDERRSARSVAIVDSTIQDLRYAVRSLASHPSFALLSALCLGLAIGVNTTVFSLVNGLLLRPLPFEASDQLVTVNEQRHANPGGGGPASYPNFIDWKERSAGLAEMAALRRASVYVADGGEPERYAGARVSWNLFPVLGVAPAEGRGFRPDEDRAGAAPVVVLSHTVWQQRYGGDKSFVGRSIMVDGVPRIVVGIMPPELSHVSMRSALGLSRVWLPLAATASDERRDERDLTVYARLRDGISLEMAGARLAPVARELERLHPRENEGWGIAVERLRVGVSARTRSLVLMIMGAVSFVLLIAGANVANLTLARAASRRREIATRMALGAPRARIVRQLLTESLLVAAGSVPVGLAIGSWGRDLLSQDLAEQFPIDVNVLSFTIGLAMLTTVLSGLMPAVQAARRVQHDVLKAGGRDSTSGPPHTRLCAALIVGEVALSLILLVGASLFVRSFLNLLKAEGGFETSRIMTLRVEMKATGDESPETAARRVDELVARLQALPGATSVAAANLMPLRGGGVRRTIVPEGQGPPGGATSVVIGSITPHFFRVLEVPLLEGRTFTDVEGRSRSPVAIVNRTLAQRFWSGGSAIGRRFKQTTGTNEVWFTVVGVTEDILSWDISDRPLPTAYLPYPHEAASDPRLLMRATGDPALLAQPARAAIRDLDPTLLVFEVLTMTDVHNLAFSRNRTLAWLLIVVAGIALLLGAIGVYGVVSYFVSQRTHEIGIRAALGADRRALVRLFVSQGMTMTLGGVGLGLAGAWALTLVLRGQLHDVSATDPLSFVGVPIFLVLVAFLAAYIPARRAAAVDPLIAMRG